MWFGAVGGDFVSDASSLYVYNLQMAWGVGGLSKTIITRIYDQYGKLLIKCALNRAVMGLNDV